MINNTIISSTGGGSSFPGLREVTAEEFLQVNKGLMLAFHRDFVCGVPYGVSVFVSPVSDKEYAFKNSLENETYFYSILFGYQCVVAGIRENSYAAVVENEGLIMNGNFYDAKLFEVVEAE